MAPPNVGGLGYTYPLPFPLLDGSGWRQGFLNSELYLCTNFGPVCRAVLSVVVAIIKHTKWTKLK